MPQPFNQAVITNKGMHLLTRAQAGETNIEFTRVVIGAGNYSLEEKQPDILKEQETLRSEKNSYAISSIDVSGQYSVRIKVLITNQDPITEEALVDSGYYINEIGLYAKEKNGQDDTEILYSIAVTSGETGDYMPPYNGYNPTQIIQEYYATVNNSSEVTIQSDLGAPALADDLNGVMENVKEIQNPEFAQAEERANIGSKESLSIIFGKIKKWLSDLKTVAFTGSYNDLKDQPDYVSACKKVISGSGWYRIAQIGNVGAGSFSCTIKLTRTYNNGAPEYQEVQLFRAYTNYKFVVLNAYAFYHYWTKIRLTKDNTGHYYIDVYCSGNNFNNEWGVIIENHSELFKWKTTDSELVGETIEGMIGGEELLASLDLPANFDMDFLFRKTGGELSGNLIPNGGIDYAGKDGYIAYPRDGYLNKSTMASITGCIKVFLPEFESPPNTMLRFTLSIYNYEESTSVDYIISGYASTSGATRRWYHCTAVCLGRAAYTHSNLNVRFGMFDDRYVVAIGETSTVSKHPVAKVHDILLGYSGNTSFAAWKSGWEIGITTIGLSTINATIINTHVAYGGVAASCTGNAATATTAITATTATKATQDGNGNNIVSTYLSKTGGTITGNLRLKSSENYGNMLNFGDSDYVHISEPTDDCMEIKAKKLNLVISDTSNTDFTIHGKRVLREGMGNIYQISGVTQNTSYTLPTEVQNAEEWTVFVMSKDTTISDGYNGYNFYVPVKAFSIMPTITLMSGYNLGSYSGICSVIVTKSSLRVKYFTVANVSQFSESVWVYICYR